MTRRWPLLVALAAACLGIAVLALTFSRYWPAARWTTLPRAELIAKARQIAEHFGLNSSDWKMYGVPRVSNAANSQTDVSPLELQLKGNDSAEVRIDSAGQALSWRAPHGFKPARKFASDAEEAADAFHFIAGAQASAYKDPIRSAGDEDHEQDYVWKKPVVPHSDLRERITVVVIDGVVKSARYKSNLTSDDDDEDSDGDDKQSYWNVLSVIFGLFSTLAVVIMLGIFILWLTRRSVKWQFPLRMAGLALVASAAEQKSSTLFATGAVLCFASVGRGISAPALPKWMSLEQICLLAPLAKASGSSIVAGILLSPLLVAIPFLIAASGLLPHSSVLPHQAELLYSYPLLNNLNVSAEISLLGFFGFVVPALARLLRVRWLMWAVAWPLGIAFFANEPRVITGPLAAPLIAGFCTLALFWFAYEYFDLLAVLTLQFASSLVLTIAILAQKGFPLWSPVATVGCLLIVAYWFRQRGQVAVEGDPAATIPALSGFQAEREKLRAEFSIARRAQQDMLPQTAPVIPGYSLAASCTPSLDVGGDLYDFLKLPDGRIGIGVADVSGKGVPAALYMTLTKGLLSAVTKNNAELARVVEEVNRHLHGVTRKKVFVTMALGFLDAEKRLLQCVRAGHNPVVWRQKALNLTTLVSPGGLGLGITASRVFSTQLKVAEMPLNDGDAVVFYSDGITEAMNSGLEQFGEERLMQAVEKADALDATGARDSILSDVRSFLNGVHPQDDMTIVVLRVGA